MRGLISHGRLLSIVMCLLCVAFAGCAWFGSTPDSDVPVAERPKLVILPFGIDVEITTLSAVKSVDETFSDEEESRQVKAVVQEMLTDIRWLFLSRLATNQKFLFVPLEQTDAVAAELQLKPGVLPTPEQLAELRERLGADLVVSGTILDYGTIRWQWLAAAAFADVSAETIALGLATAWNPALILANVGVEVLTNSAIFFGGGYVFGVAFRPVRAEARAFETRQGYPLWQSTDEAFYAWHSLRQLPESERGKKESQLRINVGRVMEELADSLSAEGFTVSQLGIAGH